MVIVETEIFTELVTELMDDGEYSALQLFLAENPKAGDVMQGTGGIRKLRWSQRGERGGTRVIYYHVDALHQLRMLLIYKKGEPLSSRNKRIQARKQPMNKNLFNKLLESVEQMGEITRGERAPSREFHIEPEDIKEMRSQLGLSQAKFALLMQVEVSTLQNWEQGRRAPTGPAKALLRAIKNDPKNVLTALSH